jgi:hypothetical protein
MFRGRQRLLLLCRKALSWNKKMNDNRDLFGRKERPRQKFSATLKEYDRFTFPNRLKRLQFVNNIIPRGGSYFLEIELYYILTEAKMSFIDGQYISVLLLSNAFIELWLGNYLISLGFKKEAQKGLKSILDCLKKNRLLDDFLLEKINEIRKLRNPFVHIKPENHPDRLTRRIGRLFEDPIHILENDAKKALSLMYQISATGLSKYKPID